MIAIFHFIYYFSCNFYLIIISIFIFVQFFVQVLKQMKLKLSEVGVIEFHEAFAGQVLANMTAMASDKVGM